nr:zinc finger BED domain-containing protein RICESLEEPER 2-like [Tanacetum cinerariifolium]
MSGCSQEQNTSEVNEEGASSSTTGKTCSNVWIYFTRIPIGPNGVARASCNSCGAKYTTRSGTTNMIRHISKCFDLSDVSGPSQKRVSLDQKGVKGKSQLDKYLEEPPLDRFKHPDLKILQYWKENQGRYPKLALMARDILSIPITTVASKSSFSIGGRIVSKYRSLLMSDNVEALLFTRDWIFDQDGEGKDIFKMEKEIDERLIEDI